MYSHNMFHICPECGCFTPYTAEIKEFVCPRTTCKKLIRVYGWQGREYDQDIHLYWPRYYDIETLATITVSC